MPRADRVKEMDEKPVMDALVQMKRIGNLLNELLDLTQQLGQAIDRNDRVSIQMLVSMREDPLFKLQEADMALRDQLEELPDAEGMFQLKAMLNGSAPAEPGQRTQQMLCDQVAANRRRLKQVQELDRMLNQRMAGGRSAYGGGGQPARV